MFVQQLEEIKSQLIDKGIKKDSILSFCIEKVIMDQAAEIKRLKEKRKEKVNN